MAEKTRHWRISIIQFSSTSNPISLESAILDRTSRESWKNRDTGIHPTQSTCLTFSLRMGNTMRMACANSYRSIHQSGSWTPLGRMSGNWRRRGKLWKFPVSFHLFLFSHTYTDADVTFSWQRENPWKQSTLWQGDLTSCWSTGTNRHEHYWRRAITCTNDSSKFSRQVEDMVARRNFPIRGGFCTNPSSINPRDKSGARSIHSGIQCSSCCVCGCCSAWKQYLMPELPGMSTKEISAEY